MNGPGANPQELGDTPGMTLPLELQGPWAVLADASWEALH